MARVSNVRRCGSCFQPATHLYPLRITVEGGKKKEVDACEECIDEARAEVALRGREGP